MFLLLPFLFSHHRHDLLFQPTNLRTRGVCFFRWPLDHIVLILSIRRMEEICKGKAADADGWAFSMDRFLRLPRVMSTSNLSVWALSVSSGESCFSQATILSSGFSTQRQNRSSDLCMSM